MYFIIPYWTEPCYRASVNGLLVTCPLVMCPLVTCPLVMCPLVTSPTQMMSVCNHNNNNAFTTPGVYMLSTC